MRRGTMYTTQNRKQQNNENSQHIKTTKLKKNKKIKIKINKKQKHRHRRTRGSGPVYTPLILNPSQLREYTYALSQTK